MIKGQEAEQRRQRVGIGIFHSGATGVKNKVVQYMWQVQAL